MILWRCNDYLSQVESSFDFSRLQKKKFTLVIEHSIPLALKSQARTLKPQEYCRGLQSKKKEEKKPVPTRHVDPAGLHTCSLSRNQPRSVLKSLFSACFSSLFHSQNFQSECILSFALFSALVSHFISPDPCQS